MLTPVTGESDKQTSPDDSFGPFAATAHRLEGTLSTAELDGLLSKVAMVAPAAGWTWALFGYGSSPKRRYLALAEREDVDVLWSGSFVPWFLFPLGWIAAAHGGLIHARDHTALPDVFRTLATLAIVEAYLVPASTLPALVTHVTERAWRSRIGSIAGADPGYFCLGADGDVIDPAIDFQAWASYGVTCCQPLIDALTTYAPQHVSQPDGPESSC
jgi:hypothetical protein